MYHPIPRFTDVLIVPIPDRLPRFYDAEQAITARMSAPRPPELDSHIGWFPSVSKQDNKKSSSGQQKRKRKNQASSASNINLTSSSGGSFSQAF